MKESQKFMLVAIGSFIFVYGLMYIVGVVYKRQTQQFFAKLRGYKVMQVQTTALDKIKDDTLIENLFKLADQAFQSGKADKKFPQEVSMTCYSLFKQINSGDADEMEKNAKDMPTEKYGLWLQQAGKTKLECQKEYIVLVGQHDPHFNETVKGVSRGEIKDINLNKAGESWKPPNSVPVKPDNSEYIKDLKVDQKVIFNLYNQVSETKDENKLISFLEKGTLRPDDVSKEGQTPLMIAVDYSFSEETIKKLIDLGCDVNARDVDGNTPMHTAAYCENFEAFKCLFENGADPLQEDNDGLSVKVLCKDDGLAEYKQLLD